MNPLHDAKQDWADHRTERISASADIIAKNRLDGNGHGVQMRLPVRRRGGVITSIILNGSRRGTSVAALAVGSLASAVRRRLRAERSTAAELLGGELMIGCPAHFAVRVSEES